MMTASRTPIVGGNWKMNTTLSEAENLARALVASIPQTRAVEVVICPPFTNLQAVGVILASSTLILGAQDVFWEPSGAFTGEISPAMLTSLGVEYVIVGHSERRHIIGESNEMVNRKVRASLAAGLKVILAIGETKPEREQGLTEGVLAQQLTGSLAGLEASDLADLVLAYEPVWAIGTGLTATPQQAQDTHAFVRSWLDHNLGAEMAARTRIQYGGSVNASNAAELLGMPDVDGALVGGASLKPDDFAAIVEALLQLQVA